jgi:hypothetical protein
MGLLLFIACLQGLTRKGNARHHSDYGGLASRLGISEGAGDG